MTIHISYQFEELALLTEGKFGGMFVAGEASIAAYDEEEWTVREIKVDGIEVERDALPWLYARISQALEEQCSESIAEQIKIERLGICDRMGWKPRRAA